MLLDKEFLQSLHIEISTACNLSCKYCFRNSTRFPKNQFIDFDLLKKVVELFPARNYVLYGLGEPLLHPEIKKILEFLKEKGKVLLLTNGVFLEKLKTFHELIDYPGVSLDCVKEVHSEGHSGFFQFFKKIEKMSKNWKNFFISSVVFEENFKEIPEFVRLAGESGVSHLFLSHPMPLNKVLRERALFCEISKFPYFKVKEHFGLREKLWNFLEDLEFLPTKKAKEYEELLKKAKGYHVNLQGILKMWDFEERLRKILDFIELGRELARKISLNLYYPEFFADEKKRDCPYERSLFVRIDGKVSPCFFYAYESRYFINFRQKHIKPYALEAKKEILNRDFFKNRQKVSKIYPWCGDCQLVQGCWFVEEGMDCYGNFPSCSECLFACEISRCVLPENFL